MSHKIWVIKYESWNMSHTAIIFAVFDDISNFMPCKLVNRWFSRNAWVDSWFLLCAEFVLKYSIFWYPYCCSLVTKMSEFEDFLKNQFSRLFAKTFLLKNLNSPGLKCLKSTIIMNGQFWNYKSRVLRIMQPKFKISNAHNSSFSLSRDLKILS